MNNILPPGFDESQIKDPRFIAAARLLIRQNDQVGFLSEAEFNMFSPEWKEFVMAIQAYTGRPPVDNDFGMFVLAVIIILLCFCIYMMMSGGLVYYFWQKQQPKKSSEGKGTDLKTGSPA